MLLDSHCHLESFHRQGRLGEALQRAHAAGVDQIITVGTNPEDWTLYHQMAAGDPTRIHWTLGLHPCEVGPAWEEQLTSWPALLKASPPPCAIGEIGLDHFHLPRDPQAARKVKDLQAAALRCQLEMAGPTGLPVIIHSRQSFHACLEVIDQSGLDWARVVFHCFSDGPEEMRLLNQRGGRGSITGIVTYPNASAIREAVRVQGLDRLMVETDAPYLSPVPHRGQPNEPAYLRHTAAACAHLLEVPADLCGIRTTSNARAFFRLPPREADHSSLNAETGQPTPADHPPPA